MLRYKFHILFFAAALLLSAGCGDSRSQIENTLKNYCRSRVEGDYSVYKDCIGGALLVNAVQSESFQQRFEAQGEKNREEGLFFAEIFVKDSEISEYSAKVSFIEKHAAGSRTWTYEYTAVLEYIDGSWRIISIY